MPIARMEKVRVVGLKHQKRHVLDILQDMGLMQVEDVSAEAPELSREVNYDALLSELEFAISFLEGYEVEKEGFLASLATAKEGISYFQVKDQVRATDFRELVKGCRNLEAELVNLDDLIKNLLREKTLLEPWLKLDVPLEDLAGGERVSFFTGAVQPPDLRRIKEALKDRPASLEVINSTKLGVYVLVVSSAEAADEVRQVIVERGFNQIKLPLSHRTPTDEMSKIQYSLIEADMMRDGVAEQARGLAKSRFNLMLVHDYFLQKKVAQDAEKKASTTSYTFMVEGWVKKRELKGFRKRLSSFYPDSMVVTIGPAKGEEPPVAIENPRALRPFEAVTNIYGLPSYKEVDPTPLLAAFFILFFGFCLGDAGYGITLSLVAYFFYKKVGPASSARKLLKLLVWGGVATFIAGAITGGWFGVEPSMFPTFLKPVQDFLLSIRVVDPVANPIGMLILALAFGVVQVLFGITIDMYVKIRDRAYLDAILDNALWIYFLLTLVAFIVQKSGKVHFSDKIGWFVLGGAAALVLTQGRKEKNPLLMLGKGILSLYKTVGYLSDTLSYSRILALGMATSIIAMVINMVAMMTKDAAPVVGYIIMLLVLVAGHIFNLAINVLGAFIHSSRLQFVEFFSKFLEGGGAEFKPFRRESKFVEIKE